MDISASLLEVNFNRFCVYAQIIVGFVEIANRMEISELSLSYILYFAYL